MAKLDHIAIVVKDLERSVDLFRDAFGMELDRIEDLPDRGVRVAFMTLHETRIELLQPQGEDSEVASWVARHGQGLHHLAISVDDVDDALDRARSAGAEPIEKGAGPGAGGARVAFLHPRTTSGVLVEFVEHGGH
ncbi:MAG: methylmalonyl-CoA epimerase [Deltaproteobacteria bacterium]|nr:methylmalonyl-CoA epimerase [Deltaproteobacteria bacterium]